jgi:hypothetical protein
MVWMEEDVQISIESPHNASRDRKVILIPDPASYSVIIGLRRPGGIDLRKSRIIHD